MSDLLTRAALSRGRRLESNLSLCHPAATLFQLTTASLLITGLALAAEFHVSPSGNGTNSGAAFAMLSTISEAARRAQPGDTVTVHEGIYLSAIITSPAATGTAPPRI